MPGGSGTSGDGNTDPGTENSGAGDNPSSGDDKKDEPQTLSLNVELSVDGSLGYVPEDGDMAGLTVLYGKEFFLLAGNAPYNVPLVYGPGLWKFSEPLQFVARGPKADFCCCTPLPEGVTEDGRYKARVQTDQSTADGFHKSFCLYGKSWRTTLSEMIVKVEMENLTGRLTLVLKAGGGWTQEEVDAASLVFSSLATSAEVKLESGEIVSVGDVADIRPMCEGDGRWTAVVMPQTVSGDAILAKITVGEEEYLLKSSVNFEKGKHQTCTMVLSKTGGKFGVDVVGWVTDDLDYGGDTI